MKRIIVDNVLKEKDVHPDHIYSKYNEIFETFCEELSSVDFSDHIRSCPSCGSSHSEEAFQIKTFFYLNCNDCASLYIPKLPNTQKINAYREKVENEIFSLKEYEDYVQNEINLVWENRLSRVFQATQGKSLKIAYEGIKHSTIINYFKSQISDCEFVKLDEAVNQDIILLYDCLEHVEDPKSLIAQCHQKLNENGQIIITTRSSSGLDIQTLWGDSESIHPLEHYQLISVEGVQKLLKPYFDLVEISTPGQLDLELVQRSSSSHKPRFLKYIEQFRNDELLKRFQTFLQENLLSSHLRVVGKKNIK